MKFITTVGVLNFALMPGIRGETPVGDFTPDAQDERVVIARAQLAASASVVGNARQIYADLRPSQSAPFLFVGRCSYEWSVDWVVWIVGDDRHLEAGAFCPGLPPDKQWLGVFATQGTRQYHRLRDFHRRAEMVLSPPPPRKPSEKPWHGMRNDSYVIATGGDPVGLDFTEPDTALGTQGGKAASLSIEMIRYLLVARSKGGEDPKSATVPDESHGIRAQVRMAMRRYNRPEIDALEEGQVFAMLANGRHFDYLEVVVPANENNVIFTFAPVRAGAHTVILKKPPKADAPFPSEDVRTLVTASAAAFGAKLADETATHMVGDRELLLIARKHEGRITCLARCNTDLDPPEPELRKVLDCLKLIGKDLDQE